MICMVCANLGLFLYFLASSLDVGVSGGFAAQSGCAGSCAPRVVGFRCAPRSQAKVKLDLAAVELVGKNLEF